MDKVKIILEDGSEKEVDGIFYLYNSKYYFIYTEKELDENSYVILHLVQVGKEIKNTPDGPLDTGYMVGIEISAEEEWKKVQESITKIVEDKKNGTQSPDIQYLPMDMLSTLKIISKKTFRLMRSIVEDNFKLKLSAETNPTAETTLEINNLSNSVTPVGVNSIFQQPTVDNSVDTTQVQSNESNMLSNLNATPLNQVDATQQNDVIIDYRAKFFEEQEKNVLLQSKIDELNQKLENIKKVIE